MPDRIEKTAEFKAPIERVWSAITDHEQFGAWFKVKLEGPFVVGQTARGQITHPGYEHVVWQAEVVTIDPEQRLFAFTWHPYGIDPKVDYSKEPQTLIEFRLKPTATGTHISIVESGFDAIPAHRRDEAYRMDEKGWTQQIENIRGHVES
jgi:uncharacterized protein YndB with AHSA1/START domain